MMLQTIPSRELSEKQNPRTIIKNKSGCLCLLMEHISTASFISISITFSQVIKKKIVLLCFLQGYETKEEAKIRRCD